MATFCPANFLAPHDAGDKNAAYRRNNEAGRITRDIGTM